MNVELVNYTAWPEFSLHIHAASLAKRILLYTIFYKAISQANSTIVIGPPRMDNSCGIYRE